MRLLSCRQRWPSHLHERSFQSGCSHPWNELTFWFESLHLHEQVLILPTDLEIVSFITDSAQPSTSEKQFIQLKVSIKRTSQLCWQHRCWKSERDREVKTFQNAEWKFVLGLVFQDLMNSFWKVVFRCLPGTKCVLSIAEVGACTYIL